MTRSDLVEALAARFAQLGQRDAELAVKAILEANGETVFRIGHIRERKDGEPAVVLV